MKTLFLTLALTSVQAFASCPALEGTYKCEGLEPISMTSSIDQQGIKTFRWDIFSYTADNQIRPIMGDADNTQQVSCKDGILIERQVLKSNNKIIMISSNKFSVENGDLAVESQIHQSVYGQSGPGKELCKRIK